MPTKSRRKRWSPGARLTDDHLTWILTELRTSAYLLLMAKQTSLNMGFSSILSVLEFSKKYI